MYRTHTRRPQETIVDVMRMEANYVDKINELWMDIVDTSDKTRQAEASKELQFLRNELEYFAKQTGNGSELDKAKQGMFLRLITFEESTHEIVTLQKKICELKQEKEQLGPDKMSQIRKEEIRSELQRCRRNISYYKRKLDKQENFHIIEALRLEIKENY